MRRADRAVTDPAQLKEILDACRVCRVAYRDEEGLAVVPLNFGYRLDGGRLCLYFHSAKAGRKVRAFSRGADAAFELDCGHRLLEGATGCGYSYAYRAIMGTGRIAPIEDALEKAEALAVLMRCQTGRDFSFSPAQAEAVAVFRLDATQWTGKEHL